MKDTIQVEIISPTLCKELNPLGKLPPVYYPSQGEDWDYFEEGKIRADFKDWQTAESQRRVFEIEDCKSSCDKYGLLSECSGGHKRCKIIGSIHTAEIIEGTNKCIIV
jgi:hypothetical protein